MVQEKNILEIENKSKKKTLKTVPGTMKIHQVITDQPESIKSQSVSCTCYSDTCMGHTLDRFDFRETKNTETTENNELNQENQAQMPDQEGCRYSL